MGLKTLVTVWGALSHFHAGSPRTGGLALGGGGEGLSRLEHKGRSLHPQHSRCLSCVHPSAEYK